MHDSLPWRRELKLIIGQTEVWCDELDAAVHSGELDDAPIAEPAFQLEKVLFLTAYIVRKLIENRKVSDSISKLAIPCQMVPIASDLSLSLSGPDHFRDFDHDSSKNDTVSLLRLCHELVHAKILEFGLKPSNQIDAFYVASDRNAKKRIIAVTFIDWVSTLRTVSENFPKTISKSYDEKTGEIVMKVE